MRAWSIIVASGPCLIVNRSAGRGKRVCPNRQFEFVDQITEDDSAFAGHQ